MSPDRLKQIDAIFLDDGGVMSDNERRGPQYRVILGDYLAPRLGGEPSQWSDANAAIVSEHMAWLDEFPVDGGYLAARRVHQTKWLRDMCQLVGVAAPDDEDECAEFAITAHQWVWARIRWDFPGATEAVRELHGVGYSIYSGSGTESVDLDATLRGMGVRELFTETYGADLVDTWKGGRLFYDRILAHAGVSPDKALFVEDNNRCVEWITKAGATAVLVSAERPERTDAVEVLNSLAALPGFLAPFRG